jgi:hypothetical protein
MKVFSSSHWMRAARGTAQSGTIISRPARHHPEAETTLEALGAVNQ